MENKNSFFSETVVVVGGGSGIGRATAVAFAARGANVAVMGRNVDKLNETVELIEKAGGKGLAVECDVREAEHVEHAMNIAAGHFGSRFSVACNFAGIGDSPGTPLVETQTAVWYDHIHTALSGTFFCMRAQWNLMETGGSIVNMSSMAASGACPFPPIAYEAAKAGVEQLTRRGAAEAAQAGFRVNCVAPGVIHTPLTSMLDPGVPPGSLIVGAIPMRRMGSAEEVAQVVISLVTCSYVTGQVWTVDGGVTATLNIGL